MKYTEETLAAWTAPLSKTEEQRAENTINMIRKAVDANSDLAKLDYEVLFRGHLPTILMSVQNLMWMSV